MMPRLTFTCTVLATVYLAHDLKHDRKVAVKVLRPELAGSSAPNGSSKKSRPRRISSARTFLPRFDS